MCRTRGEKKQYESLPVKLNRCIEEVAAWGQDFTGNFKKRIDQCKKVIKITKGRMDTDAIQINQRATKELTKILTQQEIFWKQRSKQLWLKEGDKNSKFFHAMARARRKNNQIQFLLNEEGEQVDWEGGLQNQMIDYFYNLFASAESNWQPVIRCIDCKITNEQNEALLKHIEDKKVNQAIFHMHAEKSPGPDGMSPGFYHEYWQTIEEDVVQMVRSFFVTGELGEQYTDTNIVLVPKKKNPRHNYVSHLHLYWDNYVSQLC